MLTFLSYCKNPFTYHRRQSRVVHIGDVALGGNYPIRVQSMTISDTMDTAATAKGGVTFTFCVDAIDHATLTYSAPAGGDCGSL